jgi:hypothetical protein
VTTQLSKGNYPHVRLSSLTARQPAQFNLTHSNVRPILTYRKDVRNVTFSRQIVSVIAASVLAVHVVVGCCAHHVHAQSSADDLAFAPQRSDHDHHSHDACDHHPADPVAPADDGKRCDHSCGQGACSFLAGSKIMLPDLAQPAGIVATDSATLLNQLTPSSVATDQILDRAIIPPVRSHLSKCVLLI